MNDIPTPGGQPMSDPIPPIIPTPSVSTDAPPLYPPVASADVFFKDLPAPALLFIVALGMAVIAGLTAVAVVSYDGRQSVGLVRRCPADNLPAVPVEIENAPAAPGRPPVTLIYMICRNGHLLALPVTPPPPPPAAAVPPPVSPLQPRPR